MNSIKSALIAFKHAAKVYKAKYHRPAVIIYDNVSRLAYQNPRILDMLQDIILMTEYTLQYLLVGEGSVPKRMQSRSAWSRAGIVIEIGDLTMEESINYLTDQCEIKVIKEAEKLYELVSGRIVDLKSTADNFLAKQSFEAIRHEVLRKVEDKMRSANLLKNHKYYEVGKRVMSALLNSKELSHIAYEELFDRPAEADEILEANIFSYHPEENTVTFQSRSVEYYV